MFVRKGISRYELNELGKQVLKICEQGNLDQVKLLISCSVGIEEKDCFNETPLWKASIRGHVEVVRFLLSRNAKLEVKSQNCCRTPVVIAIDRGHSETVQLLLDRGAQLPELQVLGRKLRDAATLGELRRAQVLLECRADVNSVDEERVTPLHKAAQNNQLEIAKVLIVSRANLKAKAGKLGRTPVECANSVGASELASLLMDPKILLTQIQAK